MYEWADDWALSRTYRSPQGVVRWDAFGSGPPVVLLHGTPNWSWIWRKFVPLLTERYRVFVFDWPGFGASDRHAGQNISREEQPRRLVELLDYWELERPTIVAFDASRFHRIAPSSQSIWACALVTDRRPSRWCSRRCRRSSGVSGSRSGR